MRALFAFLLFTSTVTAQSSDQEINAMDWLKGQWTTEFDGNKLSLDFSDSTGRMILSTFKQVNNQNRTVFSRFMSVTQSDRSVELQLYPNLEKSKDHFVLRPSADDSPLVFDRVYADEDCQLKQGLVRTLEVTDLEKKCDRYPVKIVYTKLSDYEFR